jgi:hypothetical protein
MEYTTLPKGVSSSTPARYASRTQPPLPGSAKETISLFEESLPPHVEAEMATLYPNFFSSPLKFHAYAQLDRASTYVVRVNDRAIAIFVFRIIRNKIHVLNEQIAISQREITRFAHYAFNRYPSVSAICFKTVDTQLKRFPFPFQRTYFTNDVVLPLPDSIGEYLNRLGKSTRENIKRYLKLLKRDFPAYEFQVQDRNEGGDELFHTIVGYNRARMTGKNKVSGITGAEADRLQSLVGKCGMICAISINGRVCAGTICYQFGDNYFMRVIAHDSYYNGYRLGLLCCYLTIGECILRGGKNFHFLWGREEYKYRFLGQHRDFDTLTIYRSRFRYIANIAPIIKTAARARITQAKLWLMDPANKESMLSIYAHRMMAFLKRTAKRKK